MLCTCNDESTQLQYTATPYNTLQHPAALEPDTNTVIFHDCDTLQHAATLCKRCNTLQHTVAVTHINARIHHTGQFHYRFFMGAFLGATAFLAAESVQK